MLRTPSPWIALTASLAASALCVGDDIRLRASVRIPAGADVVRLADVATLSGPEAEALADLVVAETPKGRVVELPIRSVRERLDAAGAHWGRLNLSGRVVMLRPGSSAGSTGPAAMTGMTLQPTPPRRDRGREVLRGVHDLSLEPTLRGAIARTFAQRVSLDAAEIQLDFDASDAERLDRAAEDYQFEVTPQTSWWSDRVTLIARTWSGSRVGESAQVSVRPLFNVAVPVLIRDVDRNAVLGPDDIAIERRWLRPSIASQAADPSRAAGWMATKRLRAGAVVRRGDARPPVLVERGDRVVVRCLVGQIVLSLQGEARADGAEGDVIEIRKLGERSVVLATVSGPGEVVIDLAR